MKHPNTFGVDVGGVIVQRAEDLPDRDTSFFGSAYLDTPALPGVVEALTALKAHGFDIHLVSKCGTLTQAKTRGWLAHHDFHHKTGIPTDHVHFCKKRREKAGICNALGVTHFVDDRLEILGYLVGIVPRLYLLNPQGPEVAKHIGTLPYVQRPADWSTIVRLETQRRTCGNCGLTVDDVFPCDMGICCHPMVCDCWDSE